MQRLRHCLPALTGLLLGQDLLVFTKQVKKNMKIVAGTILTMLLLGCGARTEPSAITAGMKWSFAQRDLQQNGWTVALIKLKSPALFPDSGGKIYRYNHANGETVDFVTEEVGKIERLYRIFDGNGKELANVPIKDGAAE